jgi:hypothetical protein
VKIAFTGHAIESRLHEASRRAGSLLAEARLETKIDLTAEGVASRLKQASDLLELCRLLHQPAKR